MINDGEDMVVTVQEYFESWEANGNFSMRNDNIVWVSEVRSVCPIIQIMMIPGKRQQGTVARWSWCWKFHGYRYWIFRTSKVYTNLLHASSIAKHHIFFNAICCVHVTMLKINLNHRTIESFRIRKYYWIYIYTNISLESGSFLIFSSSEESELQWLQGCQNLSYRKKKTYCCCLSFNLHLS